MPSIKLFRASVSAICLLGLILFSTRAGSAQETGSPAISTERPTVGDSPDLIPPGSLQFENGAGVSFQRTQFTGDLPETLVRLGLFERFEVRYMWSDEMYQKSSTPHVASFQTMDPAFSVKLGLGKANQVVPRSAIVALSLPIGGPKWTSGSYDPAATAIWTQTIGKKYFLNEVAAATLTSLASARRPSWAPSIAGGRSLTGTVTAFAEYAPTVLQNGSLEYVVDGGFALVHKNLMQFDLRTGYLKDSDGYHMLITVGYSIRRDGFLPRLARLNRP
jgi:hypothetical protein